MYIYISLYMYVYIYKIIYKFMQNDVKLAQLVKAWDCQSGGRRFDSGKNSKNRKFKSTWIGGT